MRTDRFTLFLKGELHDRITLQQAEQLLLRAGYSVAYVQEMLDRVRADARETDRLLCEAEKLLADIQTLRERRQFYKQSKTPAS